MYASQRTVATGCLLAMTAGMIPCQQAHADFGLTALITGAVVTGVKIGDYLYGARAIAMSEADGGDWDSDPAGITWNQYKSTSWKNLPYQGGWLTANTLAKAVSQGSKGSEMTVRASAAAFENGVGKAEVEYTPKLAKKAGASYWGDGWADASLLARHAPGPKSKKPGHEGPPSHDTSGVGSAGGRSLVPWSASIEASIPAINLFVSGETASHAANITAHVYAFEAIGGDIPDLDASHPIEMAAWSGQVLNESLSLTRADSTNTFVAAGSLLNVTMFNETEDGWVLSSGFETELHFTMMIPEDWEYLDLRIELEVTQEMSGNGVPGPATAALAWIGVATVFRRRRC